MYKEVGSSQDMDRPHLQALLERVKAFYYDAVADLDRLSCNTVHFGMNKEVMLNAGCLVITNGKIYDFAKQEDDLYSDLQSVLAKYEYQTIKKRLVRGNRQSAKDGNYLGKISPVGYISFSVNCFIGQIANIPPVTRCSF
jgi:DNA invertase Pin-like site-specific DNA recombinase